MKHLWIAAGLAALLAASAMAADTTPSDTHQRWTPPQSRQDAIERTQKRLDKLKAMTDEEWKKDEEAYQQRYKDRMQRRNGGNGYSSQPSQPPKQ